MFTFKEVIFFPFLPLCNTDENSEPRSFVTPLAPPGRREGARHGTETP